MNFQSEKLVSVSQTKISTYVRIGTRFKLCDPMIKKYSASGTLKYGSIFEDVITNTVVQQDNECDCWKQYQSALCEKKVTDSNFLPGKMIDVPFHVFTLKDPDQYVVRFMSAYYGTLKLQLDHSTKRDKMDKNLKILLY